MYRWLLSAVILLASALSANADISRLTICVCAGKPYSMTKTAASWVEDRPFLRGERNSRPLQSKRSFGKDHPIKVRAVFVIEKYAQTGAGFLLGVDNIIELDGPGGRIRAKGPMFGEDKDLGEAQRLAPAGEKATMRIEYASKKVRIMLNSRELASVKYAQPLGAVGARAGDGNFRIQMLHVSELLVSKSAGLAIDTGPDPKKPRAKPSKD